MNGKSLKMSFMAWSANRSATFGSNVGFNALLHSRTEVWWVRA